MSPALALLASLRPRQWVKNLFVFAGVIFSQQMLTPLAWTALGAFVIFCGLSGAIYLFNDVVDAERDRRHPSKRLVALGYGALLTAYSVWLKHMVILDVLTVAAGFVLRAVAGAVAVEAEISGWLLICTILIALFLALGKRRHEYRSLTHDASAHRPILAEYSESFLDQMISVVTASTVTAYALYTMSPETVAKFHTRLLPLTLPFVLYGIYRRDLGGNPSDLLITDRALLFDALLWMLATLAIIYGSRWAG